MKKMLYKSLLIASLMLPIHAFAGPAYVACVTACELACFGVLVFVPWLAPVSTSTCIEACPAGCALTAVACLEGRAKISVLENGGEVVKDAESVRPGDIIKTLKNGKPAWTQVVRNTKTEGDFEFIQVGAHNATSGDYHQIRVTPNHGMILISETGQMTIDVAENMDVGDKILTSDGNVLYVNEVDRVYLQDKYTLETSDGTVLASDVLVSTICDEEINAGEQLFDSKMEDWKKRHSALIGKRGNNEWN